MGKSSAFLSCGRAWGRRVLGAIAALKIQESRAPRQETDARCGLSIDEENEEGERNW